MRLLISNSRPVTHTMESNMNEWKGGEKQKTPNNALTRLPLIYSMVASEKLQQQKKWRRNFNLARVTGCHSFLPLPRIAHSPTPAWPCGMWIIFPLPACLPRNQRSIDYTADCLIRWMMRAEKYYKWKSSPPIELWNYHKYRKSKSNSCFVNIALSLVVSAVELALECLPGGWMDGWMEVYVSTSIFKYISHTHDLCSNSKYYATQV